MYLRRVRRRHKDGSQVCYVQLAHNVWDPAKRRSITGGPQLWREDQLDCDALVRLARLIVRFLDPE